VNTAIADSDEAGPVDDDHSVDIVANPGIAIEKHTNGEDADSAPGPTIAVGDPITWTYVVTNTGGATLTNIVVTDSDLGTVGIITSLAPGASQTLTKTGTAVVGQYANTGTATVSYGGTTYSDSDDSHYFGSGGGGGGGSSIISVTVGELTKAPINLYYYGLGELKAGDEIRVAPGSTGTVASLYISVGDFVEPGDLLFSLDNNDLVKNIERSSEKWNTDLELAAIKLNEAKDNYETTNSLYSKELISKSEYDKAKQVWEEAKLNYEKTQIAKTTEIENLQENLRTTLAISPGRGFVSDITFRRGESVNSADYVEIIDIEKIAVSILVPENIITRIKHGQRVVAKQASAPEYILEGVVSTVGLKADSNRTYEVIAEFDNPNQKLLPGMLIEAQIQLIQYNSNFIVPKESVITEGPDQFIFRVKDGVAEKVPVETGQSRGPLVQISGPVKEGDLLVITGQTYLQKGTIVNVVETKEYLPRSMEL